MIRSSNAPRSRTHRALKHVGVLTVLVYVYMVPQLPAQRQLTAQLGTERYSRAASGPRSTATLAGSARTPGGGLAGPAAFRAAPFGLPEQTLYLAATSLADRTIRLATNPFNIGPGDGSAAFIGIDMFHLRPQRAGGFDTFRSAPIRAAWQNEESRSPLSMIFARGLRGNASWGSSPTLFSLATLNRMMRGDLYLPFGSSLGGLRFDYDDNARPGAKLARRSGGSASAMFTSSMLRNGVTLSAGALFGPRPTTFPAGGGFRSPAAQKDAVPSLALRLSF